MLNWHLAWHFGYGCQPLLIPSIAFAVFLQVISTTFQASLGVICSIWIWVKSFCLNSAILWSCWVSQLIDFNFFLIFLKCCFIFHQSILMAAFTSLWFVGVDDPLYFEFWDSTLCIFLQMMWSVWFLNGLQYKVLSNVRCSRTHCKALGTPMLFDVPFYENKVFVSIKLFPLLANSSRWPDVLCYWWTPFQNLPMFSGNLRYSGPKSP